jgi:hypothetical protein
MSDIIWGAAKIGLEANILDEHGNVELPKTFRLLELGLLPGKKIGNRWVSSREAIRNHFEIKATA